MYQLRPLQQCNYAEWRILWEQYLAFYQTTLTEDITQTVWQRLTAQPAIIESCGVFDGDKLVGFMHYHTQINTWKIGKVYYLKDLFVVVEYRGKGLGRKLIEYLYQLAEQNGYSRVYWFTDKPNKQAQKLCDKLAKQTDQLVYKYEL